jgi:adenylate cyclase
LALGIGIAQGHSTLGAFGFEGRWDYSAIGTVVTLAARLSEEAQGGQVLIDRRTRAVLGDTAETEPLESLEQ